jgi:hypothetical protein
LLTGYFRSQFGCLFVDCIVVTFVVGWRVVRCDYVDVICSSIYLLPALLLLLFDFYSRWLLALTRLAVIIPFICSCCTLFISVGCRLPAPGSFLVRC